jgi:hypothetical protein
MPAKEASPVGQGDARGVPAHTAGPSRRAGREQADVIDSAFGQEFLHVTVGQPEPQIPAHRHQKHFGREPKANEGRTVRHDRREVTTTSHLDTLAVRAHDQ